MHLQLTSVRLRRALALLGGLALAAVVATPFLDGYPNYASARVSHGGVSATLIEYSGKSRIHGFKLLIDDSGSEAAVRVMDLYTVMGCNVVCISEEGFVFVRGAGGRCGDAFRWKVAIDGEEALCSGSGCEASVTSNGENRPAFDVSASMVCGEQVREELSLTEKVAVFFR